MKPKPSRKKYLFAAIKIAASIAILGYLYYRARQEDQFVELASSPKQWQWLLASFVLCVFAHLISYVRWGILVRALGIDFPTSDATRIGLIGLFFGLFAFGVVDAALRCFCRPRQWHSWKPACNDLIQQRLPRVDDITFLNISFLSRCIFNNTAYTYSFFTVSVCSINCLTSGYFRCSSLTSLSSCDDSL